MSEEYRRGRTVRGRTHLRVADELAAARYAMARPGGGCLISGLLLLLALIGVPGLAVAVMPPAGAVGATAIVVFAVWLWVGRRVSAIVEYHLARPEVRYTVTPTELEMRYSDGRRFGLPLILYCGWGETEDAVHLHATSEAAHYLPKRAFDPEELETLRSLLAEVSFRAAPPAGDRRRVIALLSLGLGLLSFILVHIYGSRLL